MITGVEIKKDMGKMPGKLCTMTNWGKNGRLVSKHEYESLKNDIIITTTDGDEKDTIPLVTYPCFESDDADIIEKIIKKKKIQAI